jgi:hypothetical protein
MAEIIRLNDIIQVRRRQQEQAHLRACVAAIEQSLKFHLEDFAHAPPEELTVRAGKIRKLGELLEYATSLL